MSTQLEFAGDLPSSNASVCNASSSIVGVSRAPGASVHGGLDGVQGVGLENTDAVEPVLFESKKQPESSTSSSSSSQSSSQSSLSMTRSSEMDDGYAMGGLESDGEETSGIAGASGVLEGEGQSLLRLHHYHLKL